MVALALSGLLMLTASGAAKREFFVAPEGDDENNDGLSWAQPFKTIQRAIDQQVNNEYFIVTVSNGTYALTSPILLQSIGGGVHLRSFSGNPADTVIDGQNRCACLWSPYNQQRSWYEGLTFQNGLSTDEYSNKAGGIFTEQRCFISNCVVRNCSHILTNGTHNCHIYGGGIKVNNYSNNRATVDGWDKPAAIVDTLVEGCTIYSKTTNSRWTSGGGVCVNNMQLHGVTIRGCVVTNDTADCNLSGGGLHATASVISNCTIVGNALVLPNLKVSGSRGYGAGVCLSATSTDPATGLNGLLVDSVVAENVACGSGSGVYAGFRSRLLRVAITNNVAVSSYGNGGVPSCGGALVITSDSPANVVDWTSVEDCLIEGNDYCDAPELAGGVSIFDCNCVRLSGTVIRNNRSSCVGGLNIINCSDVIVTNCVISGNVVTDQIAAVRIQNNIFKVRETGVVEGSENRNRPVQLVDCSVISNTNANQVGKLNYGGIIQCNIGTLANGNRLAYVTPVLFRNCLVADNEENMCRGWCFRFAFYADVTRLVPFDGYGADNRPIVIDHCTVAGNRNRGSDYNNAVCFNGSSACADNIALRDTVLTDNLYDALGSKPKPSVICNNVSGGTAEVVRCYADVSDKCLTVTAENGNIVGGETRFVDAAHGNYALKHGSCLIDRGGAFADWMGDGRRRSASRDLSGGYAVVPNGPYGVTVTRPDSNPRRYGAASDIGCCEYYQASGAALLIR